MTMRLLERVKEKARYLAKKPSDQLSLTAQINVALHKLIFALVVILVLYILQALVLRAYAGSVAGFGGATEITQLMNNAELVTQSAQSEMQSLQLVQQTYLAQLQQLSQSIGPYTESFQKAYSTYQQVQSYQSSLLNLNQGLGSFNSMLQTRFKEFSASDLSWPDWMKREQMLVQSGDQRAKAELMSNQAVLESTKDSLDGYQKAAAGMENSSGTHQATMILGAQLTLLGGDISSVRLKSE